MTPFPILVVIVVSATIAVVNYIATGQDGQKLTILALSVALGGLLSISRKLVRWFPSLAQSRAKTIAGRSYNCPICKFNSMAFSADGKRQKLTCNACGHYVIADTVALCLEHWR